TIPSVTTRGAATHVARPLTLTRSASAQRVFSIHGNSTSVGKGTVSDLPGVHDRRRLRVVIDADSPEEAMLKLRGAGLEPVKAEPFDAQPTRRPRGCILAQPR